MTRARRGEGPHSPPARAGESREGAALRGRAGRGGGRPGRGRPGRRRRRRRLAHPAIFPLFPLAPPSALLSSCRYCPGSGQRGPPAAAPRTLRFVTAPSALFCSLRTPRSAGVPSASPRPGLTSSPRLPGELSGFSPRRRRRGGGPSALAAGELGSGGTEPPPESPGSPLGGEEPREKEKNCAKS